MGIFNKKTIYDYQILEQYKINIEKTNRAYNDKLKKNNNIYYGAREYCELFAENENYRFYNYKTYLDGKSGCILRQEKKDPKMVVYLGARKDFNCFFHDYIFQVNSHSTSGLDEEQFGVVARNVVDGTEIFYEWLSKKYVYSKGFMGHAPSQDYVESVTSDGEKLIFKIRRYKLDNEDCDENNRDTRYNLEIEYTSDGFKATAIFPPVEVTSKLGKNEDKHIQCNYKGIEKNCPNDCLECAIAIKNEGDVAVKQDDIDIAIKCYKKALFVEHKFAEAWAHLGKAYMKKLEFNNALDAFEKAIDIDGVYGEALFGKAISLFNLGKLDESMTIANIILALYDDDEVKKFKDKLIEYGTKDNKNVVECNNAILSLDSAGRRIMQDNALLNDDGESCVVGELYYYDEFVNSAFEYCKRKYSILGDNKVQNEYIITTFYAAICAMVFYSRDVNVFDNISAFEYLNEHIDLEFVDTNAEKLLGIKTGEEKAEKIWDIIAPYADKAQKIFSKITVLTNDVVFTAIKNAYLIGIYTARYYLSEQEKKYILGTRREIDKALFKLAELSKDYENPPSERAMCYSMSAPPRKIIQFICDKCKKNDTIAIRDGNVNLIDKYRSITKDFVDLGHKAEVICVCRDCACKMFKNKSASLGSSIVFSITIRGTDCPVYSYLPPLVYKDVKYRVALSFLKGANNLKKISEDTKTRLDAETYLEYIKEVLGVTKLEE